MIGTLNVIAALLTIGIDFFWISGTALHR